LKTIFKYGPLRTGRNVLETMPQNADLLHAGYQGSELFVWAQVETTNPRVPRMLYVACTGEELPLGLLLEHVDTVLSASGNLVYHVLDGG
jgi:hypothetical protein